MSLINDINTDSEFKALIPSSNYNIGMESKRIYIVIMIV